MSEAAYQRKLIKHYEAEGWLVVRLLRTSVGGLTDLLLAHPERPSIFVEAKAPEGRVSAIQQYRHAELRAKGFRVEVLRPGDPLPDLRPG
jgi:hypothetical protein